jgi:hypothetical protein
MFRIPPTHVSIHQHTSAYVKPTHTYFASAGRIVADTRICHYLAPFSQQLLTHIHPQCQAERAREREQEAARAREMEREMRASERERARKRSRESARERERAREKQTVGTVVKEVFRVSTVSFRLHVHFKCTVPFNLSGLKAPCPEDIFPDASDA